MPLKLQNAVEFRKQPRRPWKVIKEVGNADGGGNDGISKLSSKTIRSTGCSSRNASKSPTSNLNSCTPNLLYFYQLGDHPNILKMVDHYIDEENMKASVYMELCDAGDLEKVVINQRQVSG
jgi:serine/threonine protein kinase